MSLKGKIALIVGGSQGIGEAVAHRLASDGACVGIVASSSLRKAEAVAAQIGKSGGDAFACAFDVRDFPAVKAEVDRIVAERGSVDILFNGADVFYPTPVAGAEAFDARAASDMIDINLKGSLNTIAAVTPHMKDRRAGNIVNVSSCAGVMGQGTYSTYCATKSAIIMLTRALAIELAPFDINVNAIAPGNTETPINEDIRTKPELAGFLQSITDKTPSNHTYSSPEDMANLVAFLVSGQARAMHGSTVLIDEGFSAGL